MMLSHHSEPDLPWLAAELSLPVPNDWYSDWNHESNAKSLMLSVGSVFLF